MIISPPSPRPKTDAGFTLIEIILVIVILAVAAGVAVVAIGGFTGTSPVAECRQYYQAVQTALESYRQQEGSFPSSGTVLPGHTGVSFTSTNGVDALTSSDTSVTPAIGPWMRDKPVDTGHNFQIWVSTDGQGTISVYNSATVPALIAGGAGGTIQDCSLVK